jgi:SAM-dependent methyltransferase
MKPYYPALVGLLRATYPRGGNLLEIGCGEGAFIVYARQNGLRFCGYDIHEHAGLDGGRATRLRSQLSRAGISPEDVTFVGSREPIPSGAETVDVALSIQVLEHVADMGNLFREIQRVLRVGGTAIHYFPTQRILIDPHSGVPFCHWSQKWRRVLLDVGALLGKYPSYRKNRGYSRAQFVEEFDGYLERLVHYRSIAEIVALSKASGLTAQLTCLSPARFGAQLHAVCQFFTSIVLIQRKTGRTAAAEPGLYAT